MSDNTDHRLSDSDLTVLVERAPQGSWDSQLGPASGTMWDEVPHGTKNSYREQVLSIIFHGTKALHELGYRKQYPVGTVDELDALPGGAAIRDIDGGLYGAIKRVDGKNWWLKAGVAATYASSNFADGVTLLDAPGAAA